MAEPISMAYSALILRPFISEICKDLYSLSKTKGVSFLASLDIENVSEKIFNKTNKILMIRTIYDSKKIQHISEFYYPTRIILPDESIKPINNIREINIQENIIIEGTVGHGKSMFMKHLTFNEIIAKQSLPIFIELRTIQKTENLTDILCSYLTDILDINITKSNFDDLAKSGKISLFLDGFDELNKEIVPNIINQLEKWSIKFPEMRIICSSRPYNYLQHSPYFTSITLSPFDTQDQAGFIQKLTSDIDISKQLVQKINESAIGLKEVLKTPLMITLFVMTYQTKLQIALSISEFYRDIFDVLMNRHDYLKLPYERARFVEATQSELEDIFQEFCFYTKNNGNKISFDKQYFADGLKEACTLLNLKFDYNDVISELTKNICLILKDGNEYSFIHKSIQEFFVANLLKSFDPEVLEKFYTDMFNYENYKKFEVELKFLSELDKLNYYKFLVIPSINKFFVDIKFHEKGIQYFLQSIHIVKDKDLHTDKIILLLDFDYDINYGYIHNHIIQYLLLLMIHKTDNVTSLEILSTNEYSISDFTVNDLLTIQVRQIMLSENLLEKALNALTKNLEDANSYVKSKTQRSYKVVRDKSID
ncbi:MULTISPECIES: NACHT domain-containing NTPase [unclassified Acinetobacter]|uniref:NACHT domain-containing protein n=1 Tax=unclassified Acinetobacter TaxID=196816 RepID=UPI0015D0DF51|nr:MULTISPECIES: NACHT domain-containing protein [unclassified Acinetobacter]